MAANELLDHGVAHIQKGQLFDALDCFEQHLLLHPDSYAAWYNMVGTLYMLSRYQEAIEACEKAIAHYHDNTGLWNLKGSTLFSLGRHQEAIEAFDMGIAPDPENAQSLLGKGTALNLLGRYQEAIEVVDLAIASDPEDAHSWSEKGWALRSMGRYQEALHAFNQGIKFQRRNAHLWTRKGNLLDFLGHYYEAIEAFNQAIACDPGLAPAWNGMGLSLDSLGRHQEAVEAFDNAILHDTDLAEPWYGKGVALRSLGRQQEAVESFDQSIARDQGNAHAWNGMGNALDSLDRHGEAIEAYDQAISLDTDIALPWHGKYIIFNDQGIDTEALRCAIRFYELGGFQEFSKTIPRFLDFLTRIQAPYFTRRFLKEHHIDQFQSWKQLITQVNQECRPADAILESLDEGQEAHDIPTLHHFASAVITFYMGDALAAFDRLEEFVIDVVPDYVPAQYYLLLAADGFCENMDDYLEQFLAQAETLRANPIADAETWYYTGMIHLYAAEIRDPLPYTQIGTQLVAKNKTYDPDQLTHAFHCFQMAGEHLAALYMRLIALRLLGEENLTLAIEAILARESALQATGSGYLLDQTIDVVDLLPSSLIGNVRHFAHSREVWEAMLMVYEHAIDLETQHAKQPAWTFLEKFDGTRPAVYEVWRFSAAAVANLEQQRQTASQQAKDSLRERLEHFAFDIGFFLTATDMNKIAENLASLIEKDAQASYLPDLIHYLSIQGKLDALKAVLLRLFLEARRPNPNPATQRKVMEELIKATSTIILGSTAGLAIHHQLPEASSDVSKIVIGATVGSSSAVISFILAQYIQTRWWKAKLSTFEEFQSDFLSFALKLQDRLGNDWDEGLFSGIKS